MCHKRACGNPSSQKIHSVILCGGAGTRLWPISTENLPKPFLRLTDDRSLFQITLLRARNLMRDAPGRLVIAANRRHGQIVNQQAEACGFSDVLPTEEAAIRGTAPAIGAALIALKPHAAPGDLILIMPSDANIENEAILDETLLKARQVAARGNIVLFGIVPTKAETRYGYIECGAGDGDIAKVSRFIEKPPADHAETMLKSGRWLWNSGIMLATYESLQTAFDRYAPEILPHLVAERDNIRLEPQSFDRAILEKSDNLSVIACTLLWSDIGTWESLWSVLDEAESPLLSKS